MAKEKLTVSSFVDKLVELKSMGKNNMEIASFILRHPIFVAKYKDAIEVELRARIEQNNIGGN